MTIKTATAMALSFTILAAATAAAETPSPIPGLTVPQEHFARFQGLRIRYVSQGPKDAPPAGVPAIVLIHGWTCDSSFWKPQMDEFARTHRVIAVDLPGHGGSSKPIIDYTVDLFSGSVNAVLENAGVATGIIFGHSMGVPVAMQFIQDHPEKSLGFVAVDGAIWRNGGRRLPRSPWLNRLHADYHTTAAAYIDSMFVAQSTPQMRQEVKRKMLATPRHVSVSALDQLAESQVWERGPNAIPTLAVMAAKPGADPREQMHRDLLTNLQYEVWTGAGHFLMTEQPDRFNTLVRDWMAARVGPPAARANPTSAINPQPE